MKTINWLIAFLAVLVILPANLAAADSQTAALPALNSATVNVNVRTVTALDKDVSLVTINAAIFEEDALKPTMQMDVLLNLNTLKSMAMTNEATTGAQILKIPVVAGQSILAV